MTSEQSQGSSYDSTTVASGSTMLAYPHGPPSTSMLADDAAHVSANPTSCGMDQQWLLPLSPLVTASDIGDSSVQTLRSSTPFESPSLLRHRISMAMSRLPLAVQTRSGEDEQTEQTSLAGETDLQRAVRSEPRMAMPGRPHSSHSPHNVSSSPTTLSQSLSASCKGKGVAVVDEEGSPDRAVTVAGAHAASTDAEQVGQGRDLAAILTSTGNTALEHHAPRTRLGQSEGSTPSSNLSLPAQDGANAVASTSGPRQALESLRLDLTPTSLTAVSTVDRDEEWAASNTGWVTPLASTSETIHTALPELSLQLANVGRMQNDAPSSRAQFLSHRAKPQRRFHKSFTTALSCPSPSSRTRSRTSSRLGTFSSSGPHASPHTSAASSPTSASASPAHNTSGGARHWGELLEHSSSDSYSSEVPFANKSPSSSIFKVRARSRSLPVMLQKPLQVTPVVQIEPLRTKELHRVLESGFVTALSSPTLESSDLELQLKPKNLFEALPYEVQARILRSLVHLHIVEHERLVAAGNWRGPIALHSRWNGEARGRRELIKCARVSRLWKTLAFDGQTWPILDAAAIGPDIFSSPALLRLAEGAGTFVRAVDLSGMAQTTGYTIVEMTRLLGCETGQTNLTSVNLQGCSSISNSSLTFLLSRSPNLRKVNLLALSAVDDYTLEILGKSAKHLEDLNVSRCSTIHASSLYFITSPLKRLGASRLHGASDRVLEVLLRQQTTLETLDLSANHRISDQAFDLATSLVSLAGLRHLNLSSCPLLSDETLARLVDRVPHLQSLELAYNRHFGSNDALKKLLHSTPLLKRLDLEDSIALEDAALSGVANGHDLHNLEWLILSGCTTLTEQCLANIARSQALPRLKVLELDGTHIDEVSIATFVIRQRQKHLQPFSPQQPSPEGAFPTQLDPQELPSKISVLDAHFHTRRLQRQLSRHIRTRDGRRGYEFRHFAYGDFDTAVPQDSTWSISPAMQELEGLSRVVLRSFEGNAAVDGLHAAPQTRTPSRARTWSGSGRTGCIVS
ncbi:BQ2448_4138 [Microbotryum intermedium]|uniref:BQ2448_4138 protein n=1 Tax=Microbotryum intermedium TaxID=269621 RepID=A0A238FKD6_9BASI|nr:BQ2448_4138 [Microbotryum intermedium]